QVGHIKAGMATPLSLMESSGELLEAELELATKAEERVAAHAAHLEVARWAERFAEASYKTGALRGADFQRARAARLKAEVGWLKAGGKDPEKEMRWKELRDALGGGRKGSEK